MDFKDRLIIEEKELSEKYEKLKNAIDNGLFEKIDLKQVPFLKIQHSAMCIYLEALRERIKLLDEIKTIEG